MFKVKLYVKTTPNGEYKSWSAKDLNGPLILEAFLKKCSHRYTLLSFKDYSFTATGQSPVTIDGSYTISEAGTLFCESTKNISYTITGLRVISRKKK